MGSLATMESDVKINTISVADPMDVFVVLAVLLLFH